MSKIKQYLEEKIVISGKYHEEMSWKRRIYFDYQGNNYELLLFWDEFNGYESHWVNPSKTPDWVVNWNEEDHEGMNFEWYLDELTWEKK